MGRLLLALAVALPVVACRPAPPPPTGEGPAGGSSLEALPPAAEGAHGMVSSAHPLATRAGLATLQSGGNAFDAAVTVASVLGVVEPMMSGIGGYGTIVVYDAAAEEAHYLDASGKIPVGVDPGAYRAPTPGYLDNRRGAKAVSTPGAVNAWRAMSERFGRLPWGVVLEPAIGLAEEGFVIDERIAGFVAAAFETFPNNAKAAYGSRGAPLEAGQRLVQEDLARSLRLIAERGPEAIYGEPLGEAIDRAMAAAGGFLAIEDLRADRAEWWAPLRIPYRGHEVVTPSAPAGAFPMLMRLGMMSLVEPRDLGRGSLRYLHHFAEVTKRAYWARLAYSGDPEVAPPPYDLLLSEGHWRTLTAGIDPDRASVFSYEGILEAQGKERVASAGGGENTTHFVIADGDGNVVSATLTLGNLFGSRIMPEGTGIWLNNSLAYCTFEPAGNPMDAHPGRRKLSSDAPSLILRDGRPWAALGTPGGHTITQTVAQMIIHLVDFDVGLAAAIAAPRVAFVEPDTLVVEPEIPEEVREQLAALGHSIQVRHLGNAHALTIERDAEGRPIRFTGIADPRGAGLAEGY